MPEPFAPPAAAPLPNPAPPPAQASPLGNGAPPATLALAPEFRTDPVTPRPDYIPEKFWSDGKPNVENLAKSYLELEKQRGKVAEHVKAEYEKELFGNRPATPDAYEIKPPAAMPDGIVLLEKQPDATFKAEPGKSYYVLNPADPVLGIARDLAHKAGLSQDQFSSLLGQYAATQAQATPTAEQIAAERTAFVASLGENGPTRLQHTWNGLVGVLGDKAKALDGVIADRAAFEALEGLVARASGGASFASAPTSPAAAGLTEDALRTMMKDPRYSSSNRREQSFVDQVEAGFKRLYG